MDSDSWYIPPNIVHLPDGSTLIKPGKAIQRAPVARVAKLTGVHRKTLHALAEAGFLRREKPSPNQSFFYPAEVESLLRKTADPEFWNAVRTKSFLSGKSLKSSRPV